MSVTSCPRCNATGRVRVPQGYQWHDVTCPMCEGSGLINENGREFWPVKKKERGR